MWRPACGTASAPEWRIAEEWSLALARAIERELRDAGSCVVRYGSRHHALLDLLTRVAAGDLSRAWAWHQLGFWRTAPRAANPASRVLAALATEPQGIAALLRETAERGFLNFYLHDASEDSWLPVARAALGAMGADPALTGRHASPLPVLDVEQRAAALLWRSPLTGPIIAGSPPVARRPLAALLTLAAEPGALAGSPEHSAVLLDVIEAALGAAANDQAASLDAVATSTDHGAVTERAAVRLRDRDGTPYKDLDETSTNRGPSAAEPLIRPHRLAEASRQPSGPEPPKPRRTAEAKPDGGVPEGDRDVVVGRPAAPIEPRRAGRTEWGGLLFLLNLIGKADIEQPALRNHNVSETLHRLARLLAPVGPEDPAALGFAGLRPGDPPPEGDMDPLDPAGETAIAALRSVVVVKLRRRLERPEDPEAALLRFVCRRSAEIVTDPGWIEVRLRHEDVSIEIRRAALDLDPGWLPWLGVVVRFVYG